MGKTNEPHNSAYQDEWAPQPVSSNQIHQSQADGYQYNPIGIA